jgi:hypothetical protein
VASVVTRPRQDQQSPDRPGRVPYRPRGSKGRLRPVRHAKTPRTTDGTIDVILDGAALPIDMAVFKTIFENSIAGTYAGYRKALASRSIRFPDLVELARIGDIPYSLFFAPLPLVEHQVKEKTDKLLAGTSKETFQVGSREQVKLRDVELIIKDLIRKQMLIKKCDDSLTQNKIVGILYKRGPTPEADGAKLMGALGLTNSSITACRSKEKALDLVIDCLESNQILVSRSTPNRMPQRLTSTAFSGMAIRDKKVPYIFLAGGNHGDHQEPAGRSLFTLALMSVLVARRIFAPMTWDGGSADVGLKREFDIAGSMLMPARRFRELSPLSLDDVKAASDEFQVTPSAVAVRAMRLGVFDGRTAGKHLDALRDEFLARPKPGPRRPMNPENAVRRYIGREFSARMLKALDAGRISLGEFRRSVCLNQLTASQIPDFRRAVL